jgi:hypothetical protein
LLTVQTIYRRAGGSAFTVGRTRARQFSPHENLTQATSRRGRCEASRRADAHEDLARGTKASLWGRASPGANGPTLFGVGLPLIFVSINTASYDGVPPDKTDQASALLNAARNTGGSIGISLVSNVMAHREQFHQSRLVEQVTRQARSIRTRCSR